MKRIAIVSPSFPPLGGGGIQAGHYNLANALIMRGYEVEVFTYVDSDADLREQGIHRCGIPRFLKKLIRDLLYLYFKLVRDHGIAFLFADSLIGSFGGMFMPAKIRRFKPDIVIVPDHGAPSAFWRTLSSAKTIFVSHHNSGRFADEPLYGLHSRRDAALALKFEQRAVNKADMVFCPSEYMRDVFRQTYAFAGPIEVMPNLVDEAVIKEAMPVDLRGQMGLPEHASLVYIPSANSPYKGSMLVPEIMRRLAAGQSGEIGFYLTGSLGEEQRRFLDFLPPNARVHAPGHVDYLRNISNIKACTLCISPTLIESFGMALLEAQFCGLPVVSFDVGGNRETIESGKTGHLVPFMDMEALIGHALDLLSDQARCAEMAGAARERSRAFFGVQPVMERYEKLFDSLLRSEITCQMPQ